MDDRSGKAQEDGTSPPNARSLCLAAERGRLVQNYLGDDNITGKIRDEKELGAANGAFVNAFTIVLALEENAELSSAAPALLLLVCLVGLIGNRPKSVRLEFQRFV